MVSLMGSMEYVGALVQITVPEIERKACALPACKFEADVVGRYQFG